MYVYFNGTFCDGFGFPFKTIWLQNLEWNLVIQTMGFKLYTIFQCNVGRKGCLMLYLKFFGKVASPHILIFHELNIF